jgi:hypothetical protein
MPCVDKHLRSIANVKRAGNGLTGAQTRAINPSESGIGDMKRRCVGVSRLHLRM